MTFCFTYYKYFFVHTQRNKQKGYFLRNLNKKASNYSCKASLFYAYNFSCSVLLRIQMSPRNARISLRTFADCSRWNQWPPDTHFTTQFGILLNSAAA